MCFHIEMLVVHGHITLTLIIMVLVEGFHPVLQRFPGVCGEDDGLRSLWWRVNDGQAPRFVACWFLLQHSDPGVLHKKSKSNLLQAENH